MMDKRFRPCNVSYVERLALQTKLTLAQRDCKVIYVSFGTIVMEEVSVPYRAFAPRVTCC